MLLPPKIKKQSISLLIPQQTVLQENRGKIIQDCNSHMQPYYKLLKPLKIRLVPQTAKGNITIELMPDPAPGHTVRIREPVREKAYDSFALSYPKSLQLFGKGYISFIQFQGQRHAGILQHY